MPHRIDARPRTAGAHSEWAGNRRRPRAGRRFRRDDESHQPLRARRTCALPGLDGHRAFRRGISAQTQEGAPRLMAVAAEITPMRITINDRTVQAESGDTIYVAAVRGGIRIPSLCASTHLSPYGSCRLCLSEIAGMAGLHATCSMPVRDGMIVRTESETLTRHRRNLIELYLSESLDPASTQ